MSLPPLPPLLPPPVSSFWNNVFVNKYKYCQIFVRGKRKKKKKRKITISTRSKDSLELQLQQLRDIAMEQRFPYSKNKITIVREDKLEKYLVRKLSLIHDFSIINSHIATILHLQLERSFSILFSIGIKFRNCGKTIVVTRTIPDKIRSIIRLIISIPEEYNQQWFLHFSLFFFLSYLSRYYLSRYYTKYETIIQHLNESCKTLITINLYLIIQLLYPTFFFFFFFSFPSFRYNNKR